ncbi:hypothetical protein MKW92_007892 [Papaver armeniacum]|nr:hypothetical protein MKW92_007892 [Papaver armeniacum]
MCVCDPLDVVVDFSTSTPTKVEAKRWSVGGNRRWTQNVNYTIWSHGIKFYKGDWLVFVYDRSQYNVLQVNKIDYDTCNESNPIHSWSTGSGRNVVQLNASKDYFFISGHGFCYSGMKVGIHVLDPPSTKSAGTSTDSPSQLIFRSALSFVAVWTFFFWS